ncbi:hypothetical protein BTE48_00895 [Oceanospirillum multiglobuliferum]|uniref:Outer-membrane lipoprotein carrier protein n=1 Tax=Oceanospirillum multiglobuliferum TaxID=64969 RepID=A0A1V4T969_9GAMM|nr:hypothetical protein BTE48_00895 [Oceanospirillum multiglobuliferum]
MYSKLAVLFIGLFLLQSPAVAEVNASAQLNQLLTEMNSLDADFQQRILDARGSRLQEVSGHLTLKRPGRFYWQTKAPYSQTIVSDGETLWLYDPDLEQVTVQTLDDNLSRTPAMLLSGDIDSLDQRFQVALVRSTTAAKGIAAIQEFVLKPKEQDSLFEELQLSFYDHKLAALLLVDSLGQRTSIELFDARFNTQTDETLFNFKVPDDVDVVLQ